MNKLKRTKQVLNQFGQYVISQAKRNLSIKKKNSSKDLYKSLGYNVQEFSNSILLEFLMNDYGAYQDKGVKGKKSTYPESKKSPLQYKRNMPPIQTIADWAQSRNIRLRDEKGRFERGNYKTIGFLFARSIMEKGIRASMFFTKPFEKAFENLPKDIMNSFEKDIFLLLDDKSKSFSFFKK